VALVDWDMPRMNGLEFVQFARRNHDFDAMKIMMVTTQNSMEKIVQALEAGANDFLMKPVTKDALLEKLQVLGLVD
jgi:two-component system chemotaxis response regulator CheY